MDFEKRLEAMELMLELLDQKSSCSDLYQALSTRWCDWDNQLLWGDTIARPITAIIVMSGLEKIKMQYMPGFVTKSVMYCTTEN